MKTLSIDGILIQKNEIENIENKEGKKWIKQTFLIDIGSEYNNRICFQLFGEEKVKLLEQYELGDKIEVFFNISSREYNNRYYHNIDAWRISHINDESPQNGEEKSEKETTEDSLPF
tara:strand:- start:63 stop:413 length:351 start_codon:yes stop_codon:yes gene_type:complete